METIALNSFDVDWRATIGEVVALDLDGTLCGLLLPIYEVLPLARRFAPPHAYIVTSIQVYCAV
jgi:hypothetical protein